MMKTTKRKSFIDRQYIFSFAVCFSIIVLTSFIFSGVTLFLILNRKLGVNYFSDLTILNRLHEKFFVVFLITAVVQTIVLSLIALFFSLFWAHAVAGPLVRFRKFLNMMAEGQTPPLINFREKDQLHYFAEVFRKLQTANERRQKEFSDNLEKAQQFLNQYERLSNDKNKNQQEIENQKTALQKCYQQMYEQVSKRTFVKS